VSIIVHTAALGL